tara:strand:- start:15913 stop:17898 length:1986 start_codon:yes stop_codon:yes gene_type:complete
MANREIEARLKISAVDRTGRVLEGVGNKLERVNQRSEQYNRQLAATARTQSRMAMISRVGMVAGAAAAAGVVYATKTAANFEQALFNIQKKSGATKDQMAELRSEIRSLSKEMPVSIDEIASAFERGAAAGVPLDELREFSKLAAGVADAWDTTAEHVGNVFAGFTAGMNMSRKDLQAYASLINDLADAGIADETDIADFIDRAGASLKNFGMTPEEIAAYGAAILNLKMPAEVGARAMDTLTGKLFAPENLSDKSFGALTDIVGDMDKFAKLSGNAKLLFFLNRVEKLSSQRRASLLGALLGEGFDDEVMRLVAGSAEVRRNLAMADAHVADPSNSIMEAQTKRLDLFNSQLTILKNNLRDIATELGDKAVLPWLTEAMRVVNDALKQAEDATKGIGQMSWEEEDQQRQHFIKRWQELNPDAGWFSNRKALNAYGEANAAVGRGDIKSVDEYLKRDEMLFDYTSGKVKSSTGGRARAPIVRTSDLEFPGGGRGLDAYNLPDTGVPVPFGRDAITPAGRKNLAEQYRLYNMGRPTPGSSRAARRSMLKEADPATIGMDGLGGILIESGKEIESGGKEAGRSIADGGKESAGHLSDAATAIREAGIAAANAIRQAATELSSRTASARSAAAAGAAVGTMVNADTGRTMPPSAGKPAGGVGGW